MSNQYVDLKKFRAWAERNFVFVLFTSGTFFIVIGYFEPLNAYIYPELYKLLSNIGEMVVVGGVFSSIVKSKLFLNVIGGELEKIVLSSSLLDGAKAPKILLGFLCMSYKTGLPDLSDKLSKIPLNDYVPVDATHCISSKDIELTVNWVNDGNKNKIKIIQKLKAKYISLSPEVEVIHHAEYVESSGVNGEACSVNINDILVDNESIKSGARQYVKEESGRKVILSLTGKMSYEIVRYAVIEIPIDEDPVFISTSKSYVLSTEIDVKIESPDIKVFFNELGLQQSFQDRPLPENYRAGSFISKVCQGLTLPEQGFMLVFARNLNRESGG